MDQVAIPLVTALLAGLLAQRLSLPPLVGYLGAGFGLAAAGQGGGPALDTLADLGVLLLLFGIGLKLRPAQLARPAVLVGSTVTMALTVVLGTGLLVVLAALGAPLLDEATVPELALLAFALSFSSTVFAVKALGQFNEESSLAGRLAIGILVVQDVVAVGFLVVTGGAPSWLAVPVVAGVLLLRPVWGRLLDRAGHGELLVLLGMGLALGLGAAVFDAVGVKPDLGALVVGMLLADHPKAAELARAVLAPKDLLLVGFFLSIGLTGELTAPVVVTALLLLLLVPVKAALHLVVLSRFRLRARTAWHAAVTLANHSEFGLIVASVGVAEGLLPASFGSLVAVAVAASFVLAAPPNGARYELYRRFHDRLVQLERHPVADEDALIDPGEAVVMVFGMGRIGTGAYDELCTAQAGHVLGVERDEEVVARHVAAGRNVVRGDALDSDFWDRVRLHPTVTLTVLATDDHGANLAACERIRTALPDVAIAAVATTPDELATLREHGVTVARDLYGEAGQGLADDAVAALPQLTWTGAQAGHEEPTDLDAAPSSSYPG